MSLASQEVISALTHTKTFSSKRTFQGGTDSNSHFHAHTHEKFVDQVDKLVKWLNDFLLHEQTGYSLIRSADTY